MTKYTEDGEQIKKRIQKLVLEYLLENPDGIAQSELMRQINLSWDGSVGENYQQYYMSATCEYLREAKNIISRKVSDGRGKPYYIPPEKKEIATDYLENLKKEIKDSNISEKEMDSKVTVPSNSSNSLVHLVQRQSFSTQFTLRYITSLLSKPFVILTGNSGTGKTRIAKDFAQWLGKSLDDSSKIENKLVVPVGADWTDNTKILGFYNPMTHKYQPSDILNFILTAQNNPAIPFFLVLDEMNLSHVERYFSDFLSAMESGEEIPLYQKDSDCLETEIPEKIKLPENLFVTGTVNIDETTYMFSPKVLDRANVIEFIPDEQDVLANFANETKPAEIVPVNDGSAEGFLALAKEVRKAETLPSEAENCKEILKGISNILQGSGFEFAFRTAKEIRLYINAAYLLAKNEGKNLAESDYVKLMDEQLLQKILPKIHGNRSQVGTLLKNLANYSEKQKLDESKKKIDRMLKQLENSQFTSFI